MHLIISTLAEFSIFWTHQTFSISRYNSIPQIILEILEYFLKQMAFDFVFVVVGDFQQAVFFTIIITIYHLQNGFNRFNCPLQFK